MLKDSHAFSGFAVKDLAAAKTFYGETLGLDIDQDEMGLSLKLAGGTDVFVYDKPNHQPATYTILNFPVDDIDAVVDGLSAKGVTFEQYNNAEMPQDAKGILRGRAASMGPDIAWFKDPSGNVLAILQN